MKKRQEIAAGKDIRPQDIVLVVLFALFCIFSAIAGPWHTDGLTQTADVVDLTDWQVEAWDVDGTKIDDIESTISVPNGITNIAAGSTVELSASVWAHTDDVMYLSSTYAPFTVYANGIEVASYGAEGTYPSFLAHPAPAALVFPIAHHDGPVEIKVCFTVPSHYWGLRLQESCFGSGDAVRRWMFTHMGTQTFFAIAILTIGLILVVLSFVLKRYKKESQFVYWLGFLNFFDGIWTLGESDLSCVLITRPVLLHFFTYFGLFSMPIALSHLMVLLDEDKEDQQLGHVFCAINEAFVILTTAGQLIGVIQFSDVLPIYYFVVIFTYLILSIRITIQAVNGKNSRLQLWYMAVQYVFDFFLLLELLNYNYWHVLTDMTFSLIGTLIFSILSCITAISLIRQGVEAATLNLELEQRAHIMRLRDASQHEQYQLVQQLDHEVRRQRHDLRHQIATIRALNDKGDQQALEDFLSSIQKRIPQGGIEDHCPNFAVNAIISYYIGRARMAGVADIDVKVGLPETLGQTDEEDMCAIVGNLLDNAAAAAAEAQAKGLPARIELKGVRQGTFFALWLENSYVEVDQAEDGSFRSTKPEGSGIGLASIQATAARHGGDAHFKARNGTFTADVTFALTVEKDR